MANKKINVVREDLEPVKEISQGSATIYDAEVDVAIRCPRDPEKAGANIKMKIRGPLTDAVCAMLKVPFPNEFSTAGKVLVDVDAHVAFIVNGETTTSLNGKLLKASINNKDGAPTVTLHVEAERSKELWTQLYRFTGGTVEGVFIDPTIDLLPLE